MATAIQEKNEVVRVIIVEDYKLTRVGLRSTINEFENISVVGEAEEALSAVSYTHLTLPTKLEV